MHSVDESHSCSIKIYISHQLQSSHSLCVSHSGAMIQHSAPECQLINYSVHTNLLCSQCSLIPAATSCTLQSNRFKLAINDQQASQESASLRCCVTAVNPIQENNLYSFKLRLERN